MTLNPDRVSGACASLGLVTALLAPFTFGAVGLGVWQPLAWLWILLGACAWAVGRRSGSISTEGRLDPMPRPLVALHLLFALQLVPLPPSILRVVSPGSFAAHFIPPPAVLAWAPLTASSTGTLQAWLFIAGLHGLAVAVFGGDRSLRAKRVRVLFLGMAAVGGILALAGLIQSRSAHPHWLYGVYRVPGIGSHEAGIFGPYYNRDHYSNLLAIAGSVAAGLLGVAATGGVFRSLATFTRSAQFARNAALLLSLLFLLVASAASGSRGGLVALAVGLLVGLAPPLLARPKLALAFVVLLGVVFFTTGVPAAFARMGDVDFEVSRVLVWRDVLRLVEFFPVFGCGIGAFAPAYWPYQRVVRYEYWPHVHNEYIQWMIEGGFLGMLLAAYVVRRAWVAVPEAFADIAARPALAGLAAALTHALVDAGFRIPANAAWAFLLLVCLSMTRGNAGVQGRRPRSA